MAETRGRPILLVAALAAALLCGAIGVLVSVFTRGRGDDDGSPARSPPPLEEAAAPPVDAPAEPQEAPNDEEDRRAPAGVLDGRVEDVSGAPIAGATVTLGWRIRSRVALEESPFHYELETRTDEDGGFRFTRGPPGLAELAVTSTDGRCFARDVIVPWERELRVVLENPAVIAGRVTREDGEPLAGATVQAERWSFGGRSFQASSGDDGSYVLRVPPGALYRLRAACRGYVTALRPIRESPAPLAVLESGETREENFVLGEGASVEVVVVEPDGSPARDALVILSGRSGYGQEQREGRTDDGGRVDFEGLPVGHYSLSAESDRGTFNGEAARLVDGTAPTSTRLVLTPWARIRGRVVDDEGLPVAGVAILVSPQRLAPTGETISGENGEFEAVMLPGENYQLAPQPAGLLRGGSYSPSHFPPLDPGATRDDHLLRFARPVRISLRVTDEGGSPLERALVLATVPPQGMFHRPHADSDYGHVPRGRTDERGRLEIDAWPGARYHLEVLAPEYETGVVFFDLRKKKPLADFERIVKLEPVPEGVLEGVVVSAGGRPVDQARVSARHKPEGEPLDEFLLNDSGLTPSRAAFSDESGRFLLRGVAARGSYVLEVRRRGYAAIHGLEVTAASRDVKVVLDPTFDVDGKVVLDNGEAAAFVQVSGASATVLTDSRGGFVLRGVDPDCRTLEITGEGVFPARFRISEDDKTGLRLTVRARPTFSGIVLDPDGAPLAFRNLGATLRIGERILAGFSIETVLEGRFRFFCPGDSLPPPGSALRVEPPSHRREEWLPVVVDGIAVLQEIVLRFERP